MSRVDVCTDSQVADRSDVDVAGVCFQSAGDSDNADAQFIDVEECDASANSQIADRQDVDIVQSVEHDVARHALLNDFQRRGGERSRAALSDVARRCDFGVVCNVNGSVQRDGAAGQCQRTSGQRARLSDVTKRSDLRSV